MLEKVIWLPKIATIDYLNYHSKTILKSSVQFGSFLFSDN
jgi:hypothetical protein